MTYAPDDLVAVQVYARSKMRTGSGTLQDVNAFGIVHGSPQGGGYHEGQDLLTAADREPGPTGTYSDYSYADARAVGPGYGRDLANASTLAGEPNASSAVDEGGGWPRFLEFNNWLVGQCQAGNPRCRDIREVIYTPDGNVVRRWDRLGRQSGGDSSHLSHTHVSFFRDSVGRRDDDDNYLGLLKQFFGDLPAPGAPAPQEEDEDMGANTPPIEIKVDGNTTLTTIVQSGAADPREHWLRVTNDTNGQDYALRVWWSNGKGGWASLTLTGDPAGVTKVGDGVYRVKSGYTLSGGLPKGCECLTIGRAPVNDGTEAGGVPYRGNLTCMFERGRVIA